MPEMLICPKCRENVYLPQKLIGRQVHCPSCGDVFTAASQPLIHDPDSSDPPLPRESCAHGRSRPAAVPPVVPVGSGHNFEDDIQLPGSINAADVPNWWSVHAGLRLQTWSHLLFLIAITILVLLLVIAFRQYGQTIYGNYLTYNYSTDEHSESILLILTGLLTLLWLSSWVMMLIAGSFFVLTPNARHARALAIATVSWSALMLVQGLGMFSYQVGHLYEGHHPPLSFGSGIIVIPILEIIRLTLLANLLRSFVQALGLKQQQGIGKLLIILTPSLLAAVLLLSVYLAVITGGAFIFWVITSILTIGSLLTILFLGLVLMMRIKMELRQRLPDYPC